MLRFDNVRIHGKTQCPPTDGSPPGMLGYEEAKLKLTKSPSLTLIA